MSSRFLNISLSSLCTMLLITSLISCSDDDDSSVIINSTEEVVNNDIEETVPEEVVNIIEETIGEDVSEEIIEVIQEMTPDDLADMVNIIETITPEAVIEMVTIMEVMTPEQVVEMITVMEEITPEEIVEMINIMETITPEQVIEMIAIMEVMVPEEIEEIIDIMVDMTPEQIIEMINEIAANEIIEEETPSGQFAFVKNTFGNAGGESEGDIGELRFDFGNDNEIPVGMLSVQVSKSASDLDGAIVLAGGGDSNTSGDNVLVRLDFSDEDGFSLDNEDDSEANFPDFSPEQFYNVVIAWDATVPGIPEVNIMIDGNAISAPFNSAGTIDNIQNGFRTVQLLFGDRRGANLDGTEGLSVDNLRIYDSSTGTPVEVFNDDFSSRGYTPGYLLDTTNTESRGFPNQGIVDPNSPYHQNSFDAVVSEF